jgi:hypothetical protein
LLDEIGDILLVVIQYRLNQCLECGIPVFEVRNVLFIDALPAMVRVGIVDTCKPYFLSDECDNFKRVGRRESRRTGCMVN